MAIQFDQIPGNIRVPLFYAEFKPGVAPYSSIQRLLLIGQKLAAGTADANEPIIVASDARGLFGDGSQLAGMYEIARQNAPFQEIWCLPLADAGGATKASGTITVAEAPPAVPGTIVVYIGGKRVTTTVSVTDTNATVATKLAAAINACPNIMVTATAALAVITVEVKNGGTLGNKVRIETKLYPDDGNLADELLTIVQPAGGAGDPEITAGLTALASDEYDWIVMPYAESNPLGEVEAFLADRWGPMQQLYGHVITALDGSLGSISAFTSVRNSPNSSVIACRNMPTPPYLIAAAFAAKAAQHLQSAPELSRPLQAIELAGVRPPKSKADQWTITERQSLYFAGASAYDVDRSGGVRINRLTTTYQRNEWDQPDQSWLDVNTRAQLVFGIRAIRYGLTQRYPRAALMDSNPTNIQGVATPTDIRAAVIHEYSKLVSLGVFENAELFANLLIVERNQSDPNRVDISLPLDHVNQLRIIAIAATSFLQFDNAVA